jgi:pyruvate,water dikinase
MASAEREKSVDYIVWALRERAKELNCLYRIEETLADRTLSTEVKVMNIIEGMPPGWQYPELCQAMMIFEGKVYKENDFHETRWMQSSEIVVQDVVVGELRVYYTEEMPQADEGPFLKEERKLIDTIAERFGQYIFHERLKSFYEEIRERKLGYKKDGSADSEKGWGLHEEKFATTWGIIVEMLRKTDQHSFSIISKKMINHLFVTGVPGAKELFNKLGAGLYEDSTRGEVNAPTKKEVLKGAYNFGMVIFELASKYMEEDEILRLIEKWVTEEKSHFLVKALVYENTSITDVVDSVRRYFHINYGKEDNNSPIAKSIRVALIRRFLTDQLTFMNVAKNYCGIRDFYEIFQNLIFGAESQGKLGGKSAGLFLANKILGKSEEYSELLSRIKVPKTWYITSDGVMNFIYYNNLEEVIEEKYKDIEEIRQEYPHIIQAFKNSQFPPEIINGLSRALDDFGEHPIIVRSSSLLEDRAGSAFAGKYKSLFLANQGTKEERLEALSDAIAEVFASTFGPDPLGYRMERGLLDFNEEMGIMIQEVVGKKAGKYFFPAFAGVAFSNNEFRWSSKIKREDGLIRIVPGLGTRAVDRISSEYPILIVPEQPDLKVNLSYDEVIKYSPKNIDVLNLETNRFETIAISELFKEVGNEFPMLNEIFSIEEENTLKKPIGLGIDTKKHKVIATFDNMIGNTAYLPQINAILKVLRRKLSTPVDIEFACNGDNLYLLQCRPQSSAKECTSAIIPKDLPAEKILFTANKHVSNGVVPDINYIVYVDPDKYNEHELQDLKSIGRFIGKINKLLPKKRFILMGPGRWGSRDDIRLGVNVTYSDINNTAVLIEIAKQKGEYSPDLSFGTHFFQDLVEASIRYLPLYPDESGVVFNEVFFKNSENKLGEILPEASYLADTLKVINVPESTGGMVLRILMNADEEQAVGILTEPSVLPEYGSKNVLQKENIFIEPLHWRLHMADTIVSKLDAKQFGIKGVYLFGNVFDLTAGPESDIDLLFLFNGTEEQKKNLFTWLEGWNHSLTEMNFIQTGYKLINVLDIHIVSEDDLKDEQYYSDIINPEKKMSKRLL